MSLLVSKFKNSTYFKAVTLLSAVSASLLLIVISLYFYTIAQEKEIFKNSNELYKNEVNSLLRLNSESYGSVINDITYWDEFVEFTKTKDIKWFNTSVANIIDTYNVEYLVTYDVKGNFITKVSTTKIKTKEFIPNEVFGKVLEKKFDKFYLKIPEGVVEVYGATIHPSDDPFKNKTKPSGLFFMVRLLDREYFANIEEICSSKIKFYEGNEKALKTVFTTVPLKNINNKEVSKLYLKRSYDIDFSITKWILFVMGISIILAGLVFFYYANKWSRLPLNLIKNILKTNDVNSIEQLKNIKGEFRYMGKLFEENYKQKNELITSKNKAEESDKLKSSFLMNLSHEIRTPMNAILGFSELLQNNEITKSEKDEYINIIQSSGKNLIFIIDDLVEMSKLETNLITPNYSSISLHNFIQETFDAFSITNKNSKIEVKLQKPLKLHPLFVKTDVTKLHQILLNLLNNALKFTNEGFVILDYEINQVQEKIIFSIKDSGIGIPNHFQDKIFKRFNKINAKNISANEGLGLGLAIAKAYTNLLGGEINVNSQEGLGSTFTFYIPLLIDEVALENSKNVKSNLEIPIHFGNEEIVLVAEDDNINFKLIEKLLNTYNFKVIRAVDGLEAVEICKNNNEIDLIFMDIKMPNMDGYDAFKSIRLVNKTIPIIAQTSYSFPEEINKIKELGFNDFISKPLDKKLLYDLIKKYMNK